MRKNKSYDLHPEAQCEIEESYYWYSRQSSDATIGFLTQIDQGLDVILKTPQRWPAYLHGTRRYLLPFSIVYLNDPDTVKIVAVAHHKRRPWVLEVAPVNCTYALALSISGSAAASFAASSSNCSWPLSAVTRPR